MEKNVENELYGTDKGQRLSEELKKFTDEEILESRENQEIIDFGIVGDEII